MKKGAQIHPLIRQAHKFACHLSWRRRGKAPPAGKKSPLKKAIPKFGVRTQRTALCA